LKKRLNFIDLLEIFQAIEHASFYRCPILDMAFEIDFIGMIWTWSLGNKF
jgi:hypothetical protein